ncbi:transposable element Tc1 transposase [Trichonephila clavipes]|nr:transposable element Tc1 transposase [Trichonephila clavipes]
MSSRHHIDHFMRGRIIGKIEEGRKITDVAREFDIAHSVVSRLWKSFKTTGMCVVDGTGKVVLEYHGVGRHHDQWPHAPTCGCEWDYDGQRYIDEVLLPHVRLFRGAVGDKFVFMDDNATSNRTLAVQDYLDSEGIQRLVWPARSPDLNPIENVGDALGRQVAGRNYPPTNKNTLFLALTEEWDKLPQQLLDNVVQSMVRRVECCITLHGGHIPY